MLVEAGGEAHGIGEIEAPHAGRTRRVVMAGVFIGPRAMARTPCARSGVTQPERPGKGVKIHEGRHFAGGGGTVGLGPGCADR